MRKTIFLTIIVLTVFASCKKSTDSTKPFRKNITQAVYASGKIYPLNHYKVYSKLPGYVEKIHVNIGDTVKLGQPLLTIKSEVSELNVNTAKNLLELAEKNANENAPMLQAIKEDVASAKSKYELDSANYARFTNLYKENATSKVQFDQAKTQFDVSKQTFLRAMSNLANTRDRIRTELENARIQYDAQVSNRNDYIIASTVNGKVYDIVPKEGELVNTLMLLMEIGDDKKFEVELSVDETDVAFVQKDQKVALTIDAYKDIVFEGKIMEAYPRISQGNKTSKVIATIDVGSDKNIYSGMSVEANIIVSQKENALVIPREFLIDNKKVKLKDNKELIEITKGIEDLEFVEVLNGIDENTEIIKK